MRARARVCGVLRGRAARVLAGGELEDACAGSAASALPRRRCAHFFSESLGIRTSNATSLNLNSGGGVQLALSCDDTLMPRTKKVR